MNRQNKIKALDEAFKGNLLNLSKIKAKQQQENVNCLVIVDNGTYRINSIFPKLPPQEKFLDRDLTATEYKEFLETFHLPASKIHNVEFRDMTTKTIKVFELPSNNRYRESEN